MIEPPRLQALTGVRMLAAAAVFFSHINALPGAPAPFTSLQASGYSGVTLFFMLSGFILTWNYEDRLGGRLVPRELWSFYVARFARVYPLYLFALLLLIFGQAVNLHGLFKFVTDPVVWAHVFAVQTWSPDLLVAFSLNAPAWSIGVEAFLYALFPLLLLAVRPLRDRPTGIWILIAAAILVVVLLWLAFQVTGLGGLPATDPASAHRWLYRTPLTRVPDFVVGIGIALLVRRVPASGRTHRAGAVLAAGGLVAAVVLMATPSLLMTAVSWDALYVVPSACIILGLVWSPGAPLARALSARLMVLLGEASYAFYILHVVVLDYVGNPVATSYSGWVFTTGVRFVLVCCVAVGAHFLVERPARVMVRRVLDLRRTVQPITAP